jgi:hypothetical protein
MYIAIFEQFAVLVTLCYLTIFFSWTDNVSLKAQQTVSLGLALGDRHSFLPGSKL